MSITMEKVTGSWATWAEKFLAAPVCELSVEETAMFASCVLNEKDASFPGKEIASSFPYKLTLKRASVLGLSLSLGVTTFLSVTASTPGVLVMYLCAIKYALRKKSPGEPGFDTLSMPELAELFPHGFVNRGELERLWDAQKGHVHGLDCDNLLDYLTQSLAFVPAEPEEGEVEEVEPETEPAADEQGE